MITFLWRLVTAQRALAAALVVSLVAGVGILLEAQVPPFGGAAAFTSDLVARRARAMAAFGSDAVVVLWSAPPRVFSTDTNYEYRQESNLLYLSGISEENVTLVLVPGATETKEFLFIPAADPTRELWSGRRLRAEEASQASGVSRVFTQRGTEAFDAFMRGLLGPGSADTAEAAAAGRAASPGSGPLRLALLEANRGLSPNAPTESEPARRVAAGRRLIEQSARTDVTIVDAAPRLLSLRQIKTPYEQVVLRRSVEISAEAHIEGMRAARPGRWEYEVEAAIEHWFLKSGALSWGYPSIVGSGPNATTLHYVKSTRQMQSGDLLLVDAAGNFQGLTGDITRTYPVNGRFTRDQRALYEVVLAALDAGVAAARPGGAVADIERAVRTSLGTGLLALGLVSDAAARSGGGREIDRWAPHAAVHGIGVDVHDPVGALEPGAAFVIEPGLYIRPDVLTRLEADPAAAAFATAVGPAVTRFANMGIRIEDSFLMTQNGPENLSRRAPRGVNEIERVVGTGR